MGILELSHRSHMRTLCVCLLLALSVVAQYDEADEAAADASTSNPAVPTPLQSQDQELARKKAADEVQAAADAETARKLEEQNEKIKSLELQYEQTHKRLEKYEKQSSPLSAGTGVTDGSGKTEFIKGYEGGFKVGYEAGWNMATVELQKRYQHDAEKPESGPRVPSNVTNVLASPLNNTATNNIPLIQTPQQQQPQQQQQQQAQQPAPEQEQPASAKLKSLFMRGDSKAPQFQNPFANGNNPFANGNNPFANGNNPFIAPQQQEPQQQQPQQQQQQQQQQQVPVTPAGNLQYNNYQSPFPLQAQLVPQQMQMMDGFNNYLPNPAQNNNYMMGAQNPMAASLIPQQMPAKTLPQKALNLFNNLKGMLQEGKNTINAVREALREPNGMNLQTQMPMNMQMPMQLLQQQQETLPQQQIDQAPQSGQNEQASASDLLTSLASLLQGNAGAVAQQSQAEVQNASPLDQLGLSNLAQLLATTTGTPSGQAPSAVNVNQQDSEAMGLQEMQNMIREG